MYLIAFSMVFVSGYYLGNISGIEYYANTVESNEEKIWNTEVFVSYHLNNELIEKHHFLVRDQAHNTYNVNGSWYILLLANLGHNYSLIMIQVLVRHIITGEVPDIELTFYKEDDPQFWGCQSTKKACSDHLIVIKVLSW